MIGFSKGFLSQLGPVPFGSVTVVEEPDIWRKKGLSDAVASFSVVEEVILAEYIESDSFLTAVSAAHERHPFAAVVPGLEYAVPAAAAAAERLGLPGATAGAATALRDKLLLREMSSASGVPNPRWQEVGGPEEIQAFAGCGPVVVKPSGRQASVGVLRLESGAQAERAWAEVTAARETNQLPDRNVPTRFIAEERLCGQEYSVETLVSRGDLCFVNITEKLVLEGEHPVELGHLVPAPLPEDLVEVFNSRMRSLTKAVGFRDGILHAEWMLTSDRGPVLIECAGRVPGDHILELVGLAYGADFFTAVVSVLHGRRPVLSNSASQAACVGFVTATRGRVVSTGSVEAVRLFDGVVAAELTARPGDSVGPCRSSWDRLGHVICTGSSPGQARRRVRAALDALRVVTE
jgi:biotin carboxylase